MQDTKDTTSLSRSLVYLVAPEPRGADNYWARVINGCDKHYIDDLGTACVYITPNGRYNLACDPKFFDRLSGPMKKLVLIHEAAHLALRHIERFSRLMSNVQDPIVRFAITQVSNIAMDFAVNDLVVRIEKEFKGCHYAMLKEGASFEEKRTEQKKLEALFDDKSTSRIDQFPFLLPEEFGLPQGKTYSDYIKLLLRNMGPFHKEIRRRLDELKKMFPNLGAEGGEGQESDGQSGEQGQENPEGGGGEGQAAKDGQPGQGGQKKPSKGGKTKAPKSAGGSGATMDDDDPGLPDGLTGMAKDSPEIFEDLKEYHDLINKAAHKMWQETIDKLTPAEASSMAGKLKNHARAVAKSAAEQTIRSRGLLPAGIESLVKALLEPEQIPWNNELNDVVSSNISMRMREEMIMPNTALIPLDYIEPWPGNTLDPKYTIGILNDSSGSRNDREYARFCNEINAILSLNKAVDLVYWEIDAAIQKEEMLNNLQPPDQATHAVLNRKGHGGTVYSPVFKRICGVDEPRDWQCTKPDHELPKLDLLIVVTDGGVEVKNECLEKYHPGVPIIWVLDPGCNPVDGMDNVAPDKVIRMFEIKGDEE